MAFHALTQQLSAERRAEPIMPPAPPPASQQLLSALTQSTLPAAQPWWAAAAKPEPIATVQQPPTTSMMLIHDGRRPLLPPLPPPPPVGRPDAAASVALARDAEQAAAAAASGAANVMGNHQPPPPPTHIAERLGSLSHGLGMSKAHLLTLVVAAVIAALLACTWLGLKFWQSYRRHGSQGYKLPAFLFSSRVSASPSHDDGKSAPIPSIKRRGFSETPSAVDDTLDVILPPGQQSSQCGDAAVRAAWRASQAARRASEEEMVLPPGVGERPGRAAPVHVPGSVGLPAMPIAVPMPRPRPEAILGDALAAAALGDAPAGLPPAGLPMGAGPGVAHDAAQRPATLVTLSQRGAYARPLKVGDEVMVVKLRDPAHIKHNRSAGLLRKVNGGKYYVELHSGTKLALKADNLVHHSDSRDDDMVSVASSTPMMPGRGAGDRSKYYGKGMLWEAALGRRQPRRGGRGTPEDEEIDFDDEELFSHASARSGPPRLGGGLGRMEME